jgi:hypothetical protein
MKTITQSTKDLKKYSGTSELLGVIIEYVFTFFSSNFIKDGKIYLPSLLNPLFIYKAIKFIIALFDIIKLYKDDYEAWKTKYLNATVDLYEIDRLLTKK